MPSAVGLHDGVLHSTFSQTIPAVILGAPSQVRQAVDFPPVQFAPPFATAKKFDETNDIWQARVDDDYRFYFQIDGETYLLLSIIPHPK